MGIMSLTEIMDKAIDIHKKYIKTTAVFVLVFGIISMIVMGFSAVIGGVVGVPIMMAGANWVVGAVLLTIFMMVIMGIILCKNVGLTEIFNQEFTKKNINMDKAISSSFKNMGKSIGVVFAGALLSLPAFIFFWFMGKFLFKQIDESLISAGVFGGIEIFLIIATVLFFIAVAAFIMWFLTIHIFTIHVITLENKSLFKALKRSRQLVKQNFWRILGSLIMCNLVVSAISLSIYTIFGTLGGLIILLLKFLSMDTDMLALVTVIFNLLQYPLNIIVSLFISPLGWTLVSLLYYNQLFKKEGYDLELRLKEVEKINCERKPLSEGI